jgi:hypothetical protein
MGIQISPSTYPDYRISAPARRSPYSNGWRRGPYSQPVKSDKLLRDAEVLDQYNQSMQHNCGDDECLSCGGLMSIPYSSIGGGGQKHCLRCNHVVYI